MPGPRSPIAPHRAGVRVQLSVVTPYFPAVTENSRKVRHPRAVVRPHHAALSHHHAVVMDYFLKVRRPFSTLRPHFLKVSHHSVELRRHSGRVSGHLLWIRG